MIACEPSGGNEAEQRPALGAEGSQAQCQIEWVWPFACQPTAAGRQQTRNERLGHKSR